MATPTLAPDEAVAEATVKARRIERRHPEQLVAVAAVLAVALFLLPTLLDSYWLQIMNAVTIYSIVTLGLGILIGRVGMVSLCQFVLMAVGAWVALRLSYATTLPFPLLVLIAGVVTGVIGGLIRLPAVRPLGPYLAPITLVAAGGPPGPPGTRPVP